MVLTPQLSQFMGFTDKDAEHCRSCCNASNSVRGKMSVVPVNK